MAVATVYTAQPHIHTGTLVTVQADLTRGLHSFSIVGLAGKAIEESKDRISAAIKNSGFKSPKSSNHKITVSLAPADIKKDGPLYDLPIALAYLAAAGHVTLPNSKIAFIGELNLEGEVQGVQGVLRAVQTAVEAGCSEILIPKANATEAGLVDSITITPITSLTEALQHIDTTREDHVRISAQPTTSIPSHWSEGSVRLEDIKGQEQAKRGLIIAAAGRHNVLMVGPPGTGKTMLARAFQGLLPSLSRSELLEVLGIHSIAGELNGELSAAPPFRSPHHTASHTSLVGGGTHPRPGEVTLAHRGVLFMDEFPEFERRSLDALRQPLEDRVVTISRVQGTALFPADFILLAAMNPYRGSEDGTTNYAAAMADTYKQKVSGPILDRIDLWLEVPHVDYETLTSKTTTDETTPARERIAAARERAAHRLRERGITSTSQMTARDIAETITLTKEVEELLKMSSAKLNLSPRSYHRLIKVAQTIADLDNSDTISTAHLLEALQYRVQV